MYRDRYETVRIHFTLLFRFRIHLKLYFANTSNITSRSPLITLLFHHFRFPKIFLAHVSLKIILIPLSAHLLSPYLLLSVAPSCRRHSAASLSRLFPFFSFFLLALLFPLRFLPHVVFILFPSSLFSVFFFLLFLPFFLTQDNLLGSSPVSPGSHAFM